MKFNLKLIAILFLSIFSCISIKSQNNIDFLFKRWKINYIEMNGQKLEGLGKEDDDEFEYEFRKDNSYSIFSSKEVELNGKWEWNKDENCIYFRDEYDEIYGKVVSIEKDRIILIPTSQIGKNPQLEIVKYYYIPK